MQFVFIEVLQKSLISLKVDDALSKLLGLRLSAAILSDQFGDPFDLIGKQTLINRQTQTVLG